MGERTNGYITIVAGLPEANGVHVDGHASPSRRREIAERLRKQGWSYRRISDALSVPYGTVQSWFDDAPIRVPVAVVDRPSGPPRLLVVAGAGHPPAVVSTPAVPPLAAAELTERLDRLAEAQRQQTEAMAVMEKRLLATFRAELKSLGQKLMDAIKALKAKSRTDKGGDGGSDNGSDKGGGRTA